MKRFAVCCLLTSLGLGACSSQTVKPWERGQLASEEMAWEYDPGLSSYRQHAQFSKEAAPLGANDAGGGCGCN